MIKSTPLINAIRSLHEGGRCENSIIERLTSTVICDDPTHIKFWSSQTLETSLVEDILVFRRDSSCWIDSYPFITAVCARLQLDVKDNIYRLIESLIASQERHAVWIAVRCLKLYLNLVPEFCNESTLSVLLKQLFALKGVFNDINIPHAVDGAIALYFAKKTFSGAQLINFFETEKSWCQMMCDGAYFNVVKECLRLKATNDEILTLPAIHISDLPSSLSNSDAVQILFLLHYHSDDELLSNFLDRLSSQKEEDELWQVIVKFAQMYEYSRLLRLRISSDLFDEFIIGIIERMLSSSPVNFRRNRKSVEIVIQAILWKREFTQKYRDLSLKLVNCFIESLNERLPLLIDYCCLMKSITIEKSLVEECLRVVVTSWSSVVDSGYLINDTDMAVYCDIILHFMKLLSDDIFLQQSVTDILPLIIKSLKEYVNNSNRLYFCHFCMYLWRDIVQNYVSSSIIQSSDHMVDVNSLNNALKVGLQVQFEYLNVYFRQNNFVSPSFALLNGATVLTNLIELSDVEEIFTIYEDICSLFCEKAIDFSFFRSVLEFLISQSKRNAHTNKLFDYLNMFCSHLDYAAPDKSLILSLSEYIKSIAEDDPVFSSASSLMKSLSVLMSFTMNGDTASNADLSESVTCPACHENLEDMISDLKMCLESPLNLDCIGD